MSHLADMPPPPQEADHLPSRPVLIVSALTVGLIVASLALSSLAWHLMRGPEPRAPEQPVAREVAGIEQTLIATDRAGVKAKAAQRRLLESYGWVDRQQGLVRIPIQRAFDLLLQQARQQEKP